MRAWAVAGEKGGTGKTSLAVNLGAALAEMGRHVLIVDLDPQSNASAWLGVHDGGRELLDCLTLRRPLPIRKTVVDGLDLAPASPLLSSGKVAPGPALGDALARVEDVYDVALLDCPPSLGALPLLAFAAACCVVAPVLCEPLSLGGVELLKRALAEIPGGAELKAIVPNRADRRRGATAEVLALLRKTHGRLVTSTEIPEDARMVEAPSHGKPVLQYARRCRASEAFRALAREIEKRS